MFVVLKTVLMEARRHRRKGRLRSWSGHFPDVTLSAGWSASRNLGRLSSREALGRNHVLDLVFAHYTR
jgi:hypothetical protein